MFIIQAAVKPNANVKKKLPKISTISGLFIWFIIICIAIRDHEDNESILKYKTAIILILSIIELVLIWYIINNITIIEDESMKLDDENKAKQLQDEIERLKSLIKAFEENKTPRDEQPMKAEVDSLRLKLQQFEKDIVSLQTDKESLQTQVIAVKLDLENNQTKLTDSLNNLNKQTIPNQQIKDQLDQVSQQLDASKLECKSKQEQLDLKEAELKNLTSKLTQETLQIKQLTDKKLELEKQLDAINLKLNTAQSELNIKDHEIDNMKNQLKQAEEDNLNQRIKEFKDQINELNKQLEDQNNELKTHESNKVKFDELIKEHRVLQDKLKDKDNESKTHESNKANFEALIKENEELKVELKEINDFETEKIGPHVNREVIIGKLKGAKSALDKKSNQLNNWMDRLQQANDRIYILERNQNNIEFAPKNTNGISLRCDDLLHEMLLVAKPIRPRNLDEDGYIVGASEYAKDPLEAIEKRMNKRINNYSKLFDYKSYTQKYYNEYGKVFHEFIDNKENLLIVIKYKTQEDKEGKYKYFVAFSDMEYKSKNETYGAYECLFSVNARPEETIMLIKKQNNIGLKYDDWFIIYGGVSSAIRLKMSTKELYSDYSGLNSARNSYCEMHSTKDQETDENIKSKLQGFNSNENIEFDSILGFANWTGQGEKEPNHDLILDTCEVYQLTFEK